MFHETLNSFVSSILSALESYPRVSGLVLGLATGRIWAALSQVIR